MKRFRQKIVEVEAWYIDSLAAYEDFTKDNPDVLVTHHALFTVDNWHPYRLGDWIVKHGTNEYSIMKTADIEQLYDEIHRECGKTLDDMECACGCRGDDHRCDTWIDAYNNGREVPDTHRCCKVFADKLRFPNEV